MIFRAWTEKWKSEKLNVTVEFSIFILVLSNNFYHKQAIMNFWEKNLPKKGISSQEEKIWTWTLNSAYLNRSRYQVSSQNRQFWSILIFLVQKKSQHHHCCHRIQHIRFSLCTKFHLKQIILFFFLTKFAQKGKKNVFTYHEIHLIKKELKVSSMMDSSTRIISLLS